MRFNANVTYFCEPNTMILEDTYEFDLMCVNYTEDGRTTAVDGRFVSDFFTADAGGSTPKLHDCKESKQTCTQKYEYLSQFFSCEVSETDSCSNVIHYEDQATDP